MMLDMFFALLPPAALFLLCFAALSGYRGALRLPAEPKARRRGLVLNLIRRAGPAVVVGTVIALLGGALAGRDAAWIGALLVGAGLAFGTTLMLREMRATTPRVTAARALAALALTLVLVYLRGLV